MSPRKARVDFGILPYSAAPGSRSPDNRGPVDSRIFRSATGFESFPPHQRLGLQLAEAFPLKMEWTRIPWSSDRTTVLDYQCGAGLMSQIVAPYIRRIIGIDPSSTNVDKYNKMASSQRLFPAKVCGYVGDLGIQNPDPRLEDHIFYNFDAAMIGPGFHQCPSPLTALLHVVRRLKVSGTLLILDYVLIQGYPVTDQYQRSRFTRAELQNLLEHQGLADVEVVALTDSHGNIIMDSSGQWQVVIAKGVKSGILVWNS